LKLKIGVLGIQGAIEEHIAATNQALKELGREGEAVLVKKTEEIKSIHGLIIPGGESTVIGYTSLLTGLFGAIRERAMQSMPILGTCAGLVLLAKRVYDRAVGEVKQPLLGLLDVTVERNVFGRQRESFEARLRVEGVEGGDYPAVFIRAPVVKEVGGNVKVICRLGSTVVGVKQDLILGLSFHPELTSDLRIHKYFIKLVEETSTSS
jgi:5'-phosphate synthase pdxT subunit